MFVVEMFAMRKACRGRFVIKSDPFTQVHVWDRSGTISDCAVWCTHPLAAEYQVIQHKDPLVVGFRPGRDIWKCMACGVSTDPKQAC